MALGCGWHRACRVGGAQIMGCWLHYHPRPWGGPQLLRSFRPRGPAPSPPASEVASAASPTSPFQMAAGSPGADQPAGAGVGQSAPSLEDEGQGHRAQEVQPDRPQAPCHSSARASPCRGQAETSKCGAFGVGAGRPGGRHGLGGPGGPALFPGPWECGTRPGAFDAPYPTEGKPR